MANELQDAVRAALTAIAADSATSDSAVTVKYNGVEAQGIRAVTVQASDKGDLGDLGMDNNIVRVVAGTMDQPERGKTFLVDGVKCTCDDSRLDPIGACYLIAFTYQQNAMD
jgi:hypothetical protein